MHDRIVFVAVVDQCGLSVSVMHGPSMTGLMRCTFGMKERGVAAITIKLSLLHLYSYRICLYNVHTGCTFPF